MKRNFATHPRTMRESFQIIYDAFMRNEVGQGSYGDANTAVCKPCAIGHLFTPEQREYIFNHKLHTVDVAGLAGDTANYNLPPAIKLEHTIGLKNLKAMTAMTVAQANNIIKLVDDGTSFDRGTLRAKLEYALSHRGSYIARIGTCSFRVEAV